MTALAASGAYEAGRYIGLAVALGLVVRFLARRRSKKAGETALADRRARDERRAQRRATPGGGSPGTTRE